MTPSFFCCVEAATADALLFNNSLAPFPNKQITFTAQSCRLVVILVVMCLLAISSIH